jgi:hypothetical protein
MVNLHAPNPNSDTYVLKGLVKENVGILYGHMEYFTAIWNILRPLGTFYLSTLIEKNLFARKLECGFHQDKARLLTMFPPWK